MSAELLAWNIAGFLHVLKLPECLCTPPCTTLQPYTVPHDIELICGAAESYVAPWTQLHLLCTGAGAHRSTTAEADIGEEHGHY